MWLFWDGMRRAWPCALKQDISAIIKDCSIKSLLGTWASCFLLLMVNAGYRLSKNYNFCMPIHYFHYKHKKEAKAYKKKKTQKLLLA